MRHKILSLLVVFMLALPQITMAGAAGAINDSKLLSKVSDTKVALPQTEFSNIRWTVHKDAVTGDSKLRLVLDVTGPVTCNSALGGDNNQIVVNVKGATVGNLTDTQNLDGDIADSVSCENVDNNNSKVTISLPNFIEDSDYKVFTLKRDIDAKKPFRVVVDINKPAPKKDYNFTPGLKDKVIVIDPGHGGSDSGAVGLNKTQEKDITLAIAQNVQAMLEKAGAKVLMTRTTDVDVYGPNASAVDELSARTAVANKNNADLFVSIHINSFTDRSAGGVATYYYQKTGYDAMLAKAIQDNFANLSGLQDRGIQSARFYVIKRTNMPAVLTELGFISNPNEEKLMNTPQFQQSAAQDIVQGLTTFFEKASRKGGR